MDGAAVKELAMRIREPRQIGEWILRPNDWTAEDPAALVKPGPAAKALEVSSLGALRDYLTANRDALPLDKLVVHVLSPSNVWVGGPLRDRSRDREWFIQAKALDLSEGFLGTFMSIEQFVIGVQVRFIDTDVRKTLLSVVGNIKQEDVTTSIDDGVTQSVTASAGAVLVRRVDLPNPIDLQPYRTFREVMQPLSPFVLRAKGHSNGLPNLALFEADGGAWRLTAVDRVRDWLKHELPEGVAVLA